jgi:hypothetical protein
MKEHEGNRRYRLELFGAMAAYMLVLFGSITFAKGMDENVGRTLLLITPIIPLMFAVWAIARHFRRMDEYLRLRSLESIAIGAAVTGALSLTYGFLESAGFPKLSMFWVWPVMGLVWGMHSCLRCVFTR